MRLIKLIIVFILPVFVFSCKKEKTWNDYGDYYSFDEGFIWEGKEYHESIHPIVFTFGSRNIRVIRTSYGMYSFIYSQRHYSSSPKGEEYMLSITCEVDTSKYAIDSRIHMWSGKEPDHIRAEFFYVSIGRVGVEEYKVVDGWIKFRLEHTDDNTGNVGYCRFIDAEFEFTVKTRDGVVSKLEKGYIHGTAYD